MTKGRKSKKVVRQLICDCEKIVPQKNTSNITFLDSWGKNCQCYQDGKGKFKALNTYIHKF